MSKELPYFKWNPGKYVTGDITLCSMEAQGVFSNCCNYYWMKECSMSLANAKQRYSKHIAALNELLSNNIIKLDDEENIIIEFLDEQMQEFINISEKRKKAGAKGGVAKAKQMLSKSVANPNNIEKRREYKKSLLSELRSDDFDNPKYLKTAKSFHSLFVKNQNILGIDNKTLPKAKGTWVDDIRLMFEVDKRTDSEVREVYEFLSKDDFWSKNILSASKLRENFDKILTASRTKKQNIPVRKKPVQTPIENMR